MSAEMSDDFVTMQIDIWQTIEVNIHLQNSKVWVYLYLDDGLHVGRACIWVDFTVGEDDLGHD